eukprot:333053-Prymnesium_polylepis.1
MRMSDACNTGCVGSFGVLRVGMLCCVAPPSVLVGCVHGFCMSVTIARSCLTGVSEISSSPWARLPLRERRPDPPPCRMAQGRSVNIRNTVPWYSYNSQYDLYTQYGTLILLHQEKVRLFFKRCLQPRAMAF